MKSSPLSTHEDPSVPVLAHLWGPDAFERALYLERKRAERSPRSLLLMLVDLTALHDDERGPEATAVARALAAMTRETDVTGWYREGRIIGIIFTELHDADLQELRKKTVAGIAQFCSASAGGRIEITAYPYPSTGVEDVDAGGGRIILYPEVRDRYEGSRTAFLMKRALDICGSIAGLVLFSPLFLLISVLIRLTSPGPVLFRQERVGLYGKTFSFLKFRTMYVNNDDTVHRSYVKDLIAGGAGGNGGGRPVFKITNDRRITPLGRLLRKTSMDELPQFINVLRGDMSLVGPRPPIPYEFRNYALWHCSRVVEVKPGITGLWQVQGRSSTTFDEMVRLDIRYTREWSIWLDLKILARTPWAVLRGKGAY